MLGRPEENEDIWMGYIIASGWIRQIEEMEKSGVKTYQQALEIANIYRKFGYLFQSKMAGALVNAAKLRPDNLKVRDIMDIDAYLRDVRLLGDWANFFTKPDPEIMEALIRNETISWITFGGQYSCDCLNNNLSYYLAHTKTLEALELSVGPYASVSIKPDEMHYLAEGLRHNTSIKRLMLWNVDIGDKSLEILLNAIASNPNLQLRFLDLTNTNLTDHSIGVLRKFVDKYLPIKRIDTSGNTPFWDLFTELEKEINILKSQHKQTGYFYKRKMKTHIAEIITLFNNIQHCAVTYRAGLKQLINLIDSLDKPDLNMKRIRNLAADSVKYTPKDQLINSARRTL